MNTVIMQLLFYFHFENIGGKDFTLLQCPTNSGGAFEAEGLEQPLMPRGRREAHALMLLWWAIFRSLQFVLRYGDPLMCSPSAAEFTSTAKPIVSK